MTRLILVFALVLASQVGLKACDSCGSSIMGQQGGLLSQYRKSYASLGWSQSKFYTIPGVGEGAEDIFNTYDFSFQQFLSKRWSVRLYQPFQYNIRAIDDNNQSISGFGDTRIGANYTFFMQNEDEKAIEAFLDIGGGLIIPTGQYDAKIHAKNLPENFNPGNGSFGFTIQQTNSVSIGSLGVVLKNNWTGFMKTDAGYQFGTQWVGSLLAVWKQNIDSSFAIVPLTGIQFERVGTDTYANGKEVHGTGGTGSFYSLGCQLKVNSWLCTFQYAIPMSNTYAQGEVEAKNRINLQLTHLF